MAWPAVGGTYYEIIRSAVRMAAQASAAQPVLQPLAVSSLPDLSLDHLLRMTDDTGIFQHATGPIPNRHEGYCVDDNARDRILRGNFERLFPKSP